MPMTVLLFLFALVLLYKGGDLFVDAAIGLARRFRMSEVLIGATIVSIGTTIPETTVSALAAASGASEIAYGNALGSVICNTSLIAGGLVLFAPSIVRRGELKLGVIFFFTAELLLAVLAYVLGGVSRVEGIVLLAFFACYILVNLRQSAKLPQEAPTIQAPAPEGSLGHQLILFVCGAVMIFFGSNLLVNNGIVIAQVLGVPERAIALTFIALGTSLPELITAITAIVKGHSGMSLGNIIGANFLNLTSVIGLSAAIQPIDIDLGSMRVDLLLAAGTMALLTLPALRRGRTARWQGALLICVYVWYCFAQMSGILAANTDVFAPFFIIH